MKYMWRSLKYWPSYSVRKELMKQTKIWFICRSVSENRTLNQSNNERIIKQNLENHKRITFISFTQKGFPLLPCLKFLSTFPYIVCFLYLFWDFSSIPSVVVLSSCSALYLSMNRLPFQWASSSIWSMGGKCGKLGRGVKKVECINFLLLYLWLHL